MKKAKFPTTLVFMLLVAAFATWTYYSQIKGKAEKTAADEQAKSLVPFSSGEISEIQIRTLALGDVVRELKVNKVDGDWRVQQPYQDGGDSVAIATFLSSLTAESAKAVVKEGGGIDWKLFGLEHPAAEAVIVAGPNKRTVAVGTEKAFDGSVYGRIDGAERVVLLNGTAAALVTKDPRDFRDKRFFIAKEHPLFTRISIKRPSGTLVLVQDEKGGWQKSVRDEWPLDQAAVTSYVQAVTGLRGADVWAEDKTDKTVLKTRKLDRPGVAVELSGKGKSYAVTMAPLAKEESVTAGYGSDRPVVLSVYRTQFEALNKGEDDFRDLARPFHFQLADVESIEVQRMGATGKLEQARTQLRKQGGKWTMTTAGKDTVATDRVDLMLAKLTELKAKKLMPVGTAAPLKGAKGAIWVRLAKGASGEKTVAEFTFSGQGPNVLATSSLVPRVLEIGRDAFTDIPFQLTDAVPEPSPTASASPAKESR